LKSVQEEVAALPTTKSSPAAALGRSLQASPRFMWNALVAAVVVVAEGETQQLLLDAGVAVELVVLLCIDGLKLQI
jgi:hypothetical protein